MTEEDSKKELNTIVCVQCKTELPGGTKFCTECGKPTETAATAAEESGKSSICPSCGAEVKQENNFCMECGTKIREKTSPEATKTSPETTSQITTCPKCFTNLKPGTIFCIECGVNVQEYKKMESEISQSSQKPNALDDLTKTGEEILKDAGKMGGGLLKEVGGFLDKATSSSSKKAIKPHKKGQRYLVCNSCGGYYQLESGEEPEDFDDICECGGKLQVSDSKSL